MVIALTVVHVLMCFAIVAIVLLQSGKGADIGSAFGGAGSQAVFGSMGTPTLLGKITTGVAILFTLTSFTLAMLGGERASSVVREQAPAARRRRPPRPRRPLRAGDAARSARAGHAGSACDASRPARRRLRRTGRDTALRPPSAPGCADETTPPWPTGPPAANTPAYGDTLIEASIGNVSSLIPNITSDQSSHEVGDLMYSGLVTLGRNLEIAPELAKSWSFSPDCLTLDFKLRDNVRWHDGVPFTADDVVFT